MYYYIQRGTRNCGVLFPTIFTFLWAISRPCFAELLNDNLSLVETTYDPAIYALEGNSAITNYTLPSFLANVVTKSGTFAINTTDEDQNLPHYQTGFSWDSDEGRTFPTWKPLAIATWQDSIMGVVTEETISAVDDVVKGTVVVSWKDTAKDNNGGLRVTFIANGTGSNIQRRYKHVLLVENPTVKPGEGLEFSLINSTSIGGLVWYGNWLYVGDGKKGLRVFDMEHIWKIDSKVGRGMEYAIPQVRTYTVTNFPATWQTFTFDILSLDRNSTPPCLLAGEYEEDDTAMTYLARWPFDPSSGRLKTQTGGNSVVTSVWAYRFSIPRVCGIISAHNAYYIGRLKTVDGTTAEDMNARGGIYIWKPGSLVDPIEQVLPRGAGGMAYSPNGDLMWAVGAAEGARGVVGILAGGLLGSQTSSSPDTNSTVISSGYPEDSPGSSNSSPNHVGAITGGVLSGLFILTLAVAVLYWRRRRRQTTKARGDDPSKGELPTYKPELDASISDSATGAACHMKSQQDVEYLEKGVDMEGARMPTEMPGQEPWVELEAVERPVELLSR